MQTPHEMAAEAVSCREFGNHHGYGQYLLEMEAMGLSSNEIRSLLAAAGVSSNRLQPRDPRLAIPEAEQKRPRLSFADV